MVFCFYSCPHVSWPLIKEYIGHFNVIRGQVLWKRFMNFLLLIDVLLHILVFIFLYVLNGFLGGMVVKNLPPNAGDARDRGLISGLGRTSGVGNGNPLQYSCLNNPMDRGALRATVDGVAKSQTWLSTHATQTKTFNRWQILYILKNQLKKKIFELIWLGGRILEAQSLISCFSIQRWRKVRFGIGGDLLKVTQLLSWSARTCSWSSALSPTSL